MYLLPEKQKKNIPAFAISITALTVIAWILGSIRAETDLQSIAQQAIPEAATYQKLSDGLFMALGDNAQENILGYVVFETASGYGGGLTMAVAIKPAGDIIRAIVASHKETPAWMAMVLSSNLLESLIGKRYTDLLALDAGIDGVTGATATSQAIVIASMKGIEVVSRHIGLPVTPISSPKIIFGIPEILLIFLLAVGFFSQKRKYKYRNHTRWATMLLGMLALGFIYNSPLTLAHITKLILGYWPPWQTNLYWYILLGGILFIFIADNKNPYCEWFCPFGAAQECMGIIGGAKPFKPPRAHKVMKWFQRLLLTGAILIGIYFRNPGLASYELFGTLFDLVGTNLQYIALALILVFAMFIRRPWCKYLCPISPVLDIIREFRSFLKKLWEKVKTKPLYAK